MRYRSLIIVLVGLALAAASAIFMAFPRPGLPNVPAIIFGAFATMCAAAATLGTERMPRALSWPIVLLPAVATLLIDIARPVTRLGVPYRPFLEMFGLREPTSVGQAPILVPLAIAAGVCFLAAAVLFIVGTARQGATAGTQIGLLLLLLVSALPVVNSVGLLGLALTVLVRQRRSRERRRPRPRDRRQPRR